MDIILYYLAAINLIGIFLCIKDKSAAKKKKWRVKENTFITLSLFGGSLGIYLCMKAIRHKTRHKKFMVGIPLIMVLQVIFIIITILHIKG